MHPPTVLIIQNSATEPAGRLVEWLGSTGLSVTVATPYDGTSLPPSLDNFDALVVMGASFSVHDDSTIPWLKQEKTLISQAVSQRMPMLGICLGAQLLALTTGGVVAPGENGPELGLDLVAKKDLAAQDRLFVNVPFTPDVVQLHFDHVKTLPPNAVLLASSVKYEHQGFRVGASAYGLQFHIETTPELLRTWLSEMDSELVKYGVDKARMLERIDEAHVNMEDVWLPFTQRFAELVRESAASRQGIGNESADVLDPSHVTAE